MFENDGIACSVDEMFLEEGVLFIDEGLYGFESFEDELEGGGLKCFW